MSILRIRDEVGISSAATVALLCSSTGSASFGFARLRLRFAGISGLQLRGFKWKGNSLRCCCGASRVLAIE